MVRAQAELVVGEADGRPEVCLALSAATLSAWASHRRLAVAAALCAEVAAVARRLAALRSNLSLPKPAQVCSMSSTACSSMGCNIK